jgi:hypothetical protein
MTESTSALRFLNPEKQKKPAAGCQLQAGSWQL